MCSQIWDWQRGVLLIVCSLCLCRVSSHEERTRRWGPDYILLWALQKLDYAHQTTDTHLGGRKERKRRRREERCTDSYSLVPTSCASVGSDGNRSSTQTYTSVVQLKCSKVVFTSEESSLTVSNQCLHCMYHVGNAHGGESGTETSVERPPMRHRAVGMQRLRSWLRCPTSIQ